MTTVLYLIPEVETRTGNPGAFKHNSGDVHQHMKQKLIPNIERSNVSMSVVKSSRNHEMLNKIIMMKNQKNVE